MNPPDAGGRPAADGALDEVDLAILDGIREVFQAVDPMPADLPERIRFSLALRDLEVEVARLVADEDQRVPAARGDELSRNSVAPASAYDARLLLATGEQEEGGDGHDPVAGSRLGVGVDVEADDLQAFAELNGHCLDLRTHETARPAPLRPEVDEDRGCRLQDVGLEVVVRDLGDLAHVTSFWSRLPCRLVGCPAG